MPSTLPDGDPAPLDGALPAQSLEALGERPFGVYIHVPFCASRCGYCDFNTYTSAELGGGASQHEYAATVAREMELAALVLGRDRPRASTVFFGGGTPTLLPAADLGAVLGCVRTMFGLSSDAEITTEANPESVDARYLEELRGAGFTRVSFGMQSSSSKVLAVLDRAHSAGRAVDAVADARAAGFEHVNVDLIYGSPGETDDEWQVSVEAAIESGADHVSAYSLIVEPGTRLAARIGRGELPAPDDDVLADRYTIADELLTAAGFEWYEVSNWARSAQARSRHNLLYWQGADWWGFGPGAHSHVGGVRWWNVKHPRDYVARVTEPQSPAAGRETLDDDQRYAERVLLELRLADGLPLAALRGDGLVAAKRAADDGLLEAVALSEGTARLTMRGRLLADAVVRDLLPS